jgi:hypothetical protein
MPISLECARGTQLGIESCKDGLSLPEEIVEPVRLAAQLGLGDGERKARDDRGSVREVLGQLADLIQEIGKVRLRVRLILRQERVPVSRGIDDRHRADALKAAGLSE